MAAIWRPHRIRIGAGIGITPFVLRKKERAAPAGDGKPARDGRAGKAA